MIYSVRRYSAILGLSGGSLGIKRNKDGSTRKYDMNLNRLGQMRSAQSELRGSLDQELRKAKKELREDGNI